MRRMNTRQVILLTTSLLFLIGLSACLSSNDMQSTPVPPVISPTATVTATLPPSPVPATFTPTPLTCLTEPGLVKTDTVPTTKPPQQFMIYLPPCYENSTDIRYPVLYLLHGQTYNQDQWVRLGVPEIADRLIHSNQAMPFIVIFPDDRYWNSQAGPGFGNRLINDLIPYVDKNYRTIADREHRSLGGLSRGGGWTVQLGFDHPELFGSLGLHSPAIFKDNAPFVERIIQSIPQETRPKLWLDIGDSDMELARALVLEDILTRNTYLHEFHLFTGDHTEIYWSAHVEKYLRWYTESWQDNSTDQ
jgi:enterochelin esterase-like enzyme